MCLLSAVILLFSLHNVGLRLSSWFLNNTNFLTTLLSLKSNNPFWMVEGKIVGVLIIISFLLLALSLTT